jgi:hypothetical protein
LLTNIAQNINQAILAVSVRPAPEQRVLANVLAAIAGQYQLRLVGDDDKPIPAPEFKSAGHTEDDVAARGESNDTNEDEGSDSEYRPGPSRRKARATTTTTATKTTTTTTATEDALVHDRVVFTKILHPVFSAHIIEEMVSARTAFYRAVRDAVGEHETPLFPDTPKGKAELRDMVNYIFTSVLGGARPRIISIIKEYQGSPDNHLAPATAVLAEAFSRDEDLPQPIRDLFGRFALVKQCEIKDSSSYGGLWRHVRFVQFLNAHHAVLEGMDANGAIAEELANKGFVTAQGHSRSTVVQRYFMAKLLITQDSQKKQFANYLNNARAINVLIETFGPGILCMLPSNAYYK